MAQSQDDFNDDNPYGLDKFTNQMLKQGNPTAAPAVDPAVWTPSAPPGSGGDPGQGFASDWAPGATAPTNAPPGMHWNADKAMYEYDSAAPAPVVTPTAPDERQDTPTASAPVAATSAVIRPNVAPVTPAAYVPGSGVPGQGTVFGASNPLTADQNALFAMLMGRAKQSLDVSPDDPIISRQTGAFSATQQRAQRDYESKLAESAGPNTNIGAERRFGAERVGQNTSAFQATMMGQELAARRNEIQSALQGAQGMLTAEQQMRLQEELAQLSLAQSAYQFDTNQQYLNSPLNG